MQASRGFERRPGRRDLQPTVIIDSKPEEAKDPDVESTYVRIKRADLERILMLVERLERRID
jgi:hypothetical protein